MSGGQASQIEATGLATGLQAPLPFEVTKEFWGFSEDTAAADEFWS